MSRLRARLLGVRASLRARIASSRVRVRVGRGVRVAPQLRLVIGRRSRSAMSLGSGVRVGRACGLSLRGGSLEVGRGSRLDGNVLIETEDGRVEIGNDARLREGCVVRSRGGAVSLGGAAELGEFAVVLASPDGPVRVGAGAVIGVKATLLPGAIVPAGARVPPNAVVLGPFTPAPAGGRRRPRPARPARPRSPRGARPG